MSDKDLKVKISAKDDGFGATLRRTKADLDAALNIGGSIGSKLSGGILGGGVAGVVLSVIDKVTSLVRETAILVDKAQDLSIPTSAAVGINNQARLAGARSEGVFAAVEASVQARADALAGDPRAIEQFKRIGVSLAEIEKLSPDETFFRIADAFKGIKLDAERKVASSVLFGQGVNDVLPFIIGAGSSVFRPRSEDALIGSQLISGLTGPAYQFFRAGILNRGNSLKADIDPVSTYSVDAAKQTARLRENNAFREEAIARSQLSIEDQLLDLVRQRLEVNRLIELESSEFRKEQLRSRLLDIEEQRLRLKAAIEKSDQKNQNTPNGVLQNRNLDELYRAGIFTGGRPVDLVETMRLQLDEAKTTNRQLSDLPAKLATEI